MPLPPEVFAQSVRVLGRHTSGSLPRYKCPH
jgi:hypothetical protein